MRYRSNCDWMLFLTSPMAFVGFEPMALTCIMYIKLSIMVDCKLCGIFNDDSKKMLDCIYL